MGEDKFVPRLCGGTFFSLMLKARVDTRKSQTYLFKELMKLYDPSVAGVYLGSFKTPTSQFRNCNQRYSCDYIKLGDTTTKRAFEDRFDKCYEELLSETEKICNEYLTKGRFSKSEIFIKDILALIYKDDSIAADEKLYIEFGGKYILKKDLIKLETVYFSSAVLGLWHFICTRRTDNSVGSETIAMWEREPFGGDEGTFSHIRIMFNRPEFIEAEEKQEAKPYIKDITELVRSKWEQAITERPERIAKPRKMKSPYEVYIEHAKNAFITSKSFFYPNC